MLHTYELRWFFSECPLKLSNHLENESELQSRTDWYALPCSPNCGIKLREGKLETKIRCHAGSVQQSGNLTGRLESYKKWSLQFPSEDRPTFEDLGLAGWVEVGKERNLLRFRVDDQQDIHHSPTRPENGCEFELTRLTVPRGIFWTVGLEAMGNVDQLESNLLTVMRFAEQAGGRQQPFNLQNSMGYAEWLSQH